MCRCDLPSFFASSSCVHPSDSGCIAAHNPARTAIVLGSGKTPVGKPMDQIEQLQSIIRDCQKILTAHLVPGGPDAKTTITDLLEILDGPRARAVQGNR